MLRNGRMGAAIVAVANTLFLGVSVIAKGDETLAWSEWRGPNATGVALNSKPPIEWSPEKNIRWRTALPGRGHSTPVVLDNRIFLTAAVPFGSKLAPKMSGRPGEHDNLPVDSKFQFIVMCVDRKDGKLLWSKVVHEALPVEAGHNTASLASASPVIDSQHIYAHFGSHGLYCLDFDGNVKWQKNFGQMHSKHGHGEGASPTLSGNTLIVNWDHEEKSFLVALDKTTGKELWRRDRDEDTSWSSPIVIELDGKKQVVVCGTNRVRGYDLQTGEILWHCGGMSSNIVATLSKRPNTSTWSNRKGLPRSDTLRLARQYLCVAGRSQRPRLCHGFGWNNGGDYAHRDSSNRRCQST